LFFNIEDTPATSGAPADEYRFDGATGHGFGQFGMGKLQPEGCAFIDAALDAERAAHGVGQASREGQPRPVPSTVVCSAPSRSNG